MDSLLQKLCKFQPTPVAGRGATHAIAVSMLPIPRAVSVSRYRAFHDGWLDSYGKAWSGNFTRGREPAFLVNPRYARSATLPPSCPGNYINISYPE